METTYIEMTDLEVRDAGGGRHELEGLCVPYNQPSHRARPEGPELFRPGSFASAVTADPRKIRLTEYHPTSDTGRRPVGVATAFEERAAGLYGRFRFYNTPQGNAAFANAKEQTYGGLSVGFAAVRDRETTDGREVLEARLHHVALVDDPAYDGAQVLAVRAARPAGDDRYAIFRNAPQLEVADVDDTPLMVRLRRQMSR